MSGHSDSYELPREKLTRVTDAVRNDKGYVEFCCRECGEWKRTLKFDPTSVLRRADDGPESAIALAWDFKTPLCYECSVPRS